MKSADDLLQFLGRDDVTEVAIATARLPCIKTPEGYQPVDRTTLSTDAILRVLTSMGGDRHVNELGSAPAQWTYRAQGIGMVTIAAARRGEALQARLVLAQRETHAATQSAALPEPRFEATIAPTSTSTSTS